MRSVKNALGVADNTAYTYGATLPLNQGLGMNQGYGFNQGLGMNQGYGLNQGLGMNQGLGYGAQQFGQGFGSQGLMSQGLMNQGLGYGAQQFGNQGWGSSGLSSGLPAQTVVQTTTVPIDTPPSPSMSQAPLTPSSQNWQQSSNQNWQQSSNLNWQQQQQQPIQKQYQQGLVQRREAAPVVHERIRREEVEEIQPVIHREREKTEIHKITQPIQTSSTLGVITEEGTLPAQVNPEIRTPGMMSPSAPLPTREQLAGQRMRVEKPALIIETEKKNIIEEVQPVVYKEVVEPHIIRLTQPIYERIVEGEVYYNETLPTRTEFTQFQQQPQFQQQQFQQRDLQQGQFQGQQGHFLQPIQIKTFVQPVPVAMSSPMIGQPLMKENLEVAATYVSEVPSHKGRYGHYGKGSSYAYGPGTTAAPLAQPRAI